MRGQRFWKCHGCSLVFARRQGNANFHESIDDFEPAYRQYLEEGPVDAANLGDTLAWIETHISLTNPGIRLLDVGAGSGKLVRHLRRVRPCVVSGIEPSAAIFQAYRLDTLKILPIGLPELAASSPGSYDVVTALDVIEHVPDAVEFIQALAQVTKPGGFVFLSTPDASGPLAVLLGRHWHHYNAYHFSLYSTPTMAEAARRFGFRLVAVEHRAKRMSLDYLWNYAKDFLFVRRSKSTGPPGNSMAISVNLRDILSVVLVREPR
jgi:2-polyprenyl-3-methyl-5-hydroxy-6-metoxy-1,4-benzoquinol methylase